MSKDPRGRLFHCPFQLYGEKEKDREKTRRKVPNLNAVEVIVCFFFNASTIVQNLFSFNIFYNLFRLWKTLSVLPSASAKILGVVLIKCILGELHNRRN